MYSLLKYIAHPNSKQLSSQPVGYNCRPTWHPAYTQIILTFLDAYDLTGSCSCVEFYIIKLWYLTPCHRNAAPNCSHQLLAFFVRRSSLAFLLPFNSGVCPCFLVVRFVCSVISEPALGTTHCTTIAYVCILLFQRLFWRLQSVQLLAERQ